MTDLHLRGEDEPARQVPYQCTVCGGVARTACRKPRCLGAPTRPHGEATMARIDERDAPSREGVEPLVLR